jgi:hypothetical protein
MVRGRKEMKAPDLGSILKTTTLGGTVAVGRTKATVHSGSSVRTPLSSDDMLEWKVFFSFFLSFFLTLFLSFFVSFLFFFLLSFEFELKESRV